MPYWHIYPQISSSKVFAWSCCQRNLLLRSTLSIICLLQYELSPGRSNPPNLTKRTVDFVCESHASQACFQCWIKSQVLFCGINDTFANARISACFQSLQSLAIQNCLGNHAFPWSVNLKLDRWFIQICSPVELPQTIMDLPASNWPVP